MTMWPALPTPIRCTYCWRHAVARWMLGLPVGRLTEHKPCTPLKVAKVGQR